MVALPESSPFAERRDELVSEFRSPECPCEIAAQHEREAALIAGAERLIESGSNDLDAIYHALRAAAIAHLDRMRDRSREREG